MSRIDDAVDNLINVIRESNEFNKYHGMLEKINRYPDLKKRVDEFRLKNFELQNSDMDRFWLAQETDRFDREYEKLRSDPLVHGFLAEELALCRLMQDVFGRIVEAIEFE